MIGFPSTATVSYGSEHLASPQTLVQATFVLLSTFHSVLLISSFLLRVCVQFCLGQGANVLFKCVRHVLQRPVGSGPPLELGEGFLTACYCFSILLSLSCWLRAGGWPTAVGWRKMRRSQWCPGLLKLSFAKAVVTDSNQTPHLAGLSSL